MDQQVLGPQNRRIVELRRLVGRRNLRSDEIVLEGARTVGEAFDAGVRVLTVVVPESRIGDPAVVAVHERIPAGVECLVVRDKVFARLAPSTTPQPMMAVATRPRAAIPDRLIEGDLVLVLIDVGDPGNTGTLVRVADAVAARCVVVVGGADPWSPKAVRASAGSALRVPVVSDIDAPTALARLGAAGARVVATDAHEGQPHDSGVLAGTVAIVLGSEAHGLDRSIAPLIDAWARIDMPGRAESLNVAMAGTLFAYEATRSPSSG